MGRRREIRSIRQARTAPVNAAISRNETGCVSDPLPPASRGGSPPLQGGECRVPFPCLSGLYPLISPLQRGTAAPQSGRQGFAQWRHYFLTYLVTPRSCASAV